MNERTLLEPRPTEPVERQPVPAFRIFPDRLDGSDDEPGEVQPLTSQEKAVGRERAGRLVTESPDEASRSAARDGRTPQHEFLAIVPLRTEPGQLHALRTVLRQIQEHDVETNEIIPFLQLRTIHFARFVIHDRSPRTDGDKLPIRPVPPKLLFSTNFDGELADHLAELLTVRSGLDAVFEHCVGYPGRGATDQQVLSFLLAHKLRANTFYVGTRGRSVLQIRREAELREVIEKFLDKESGKPEFPREPLALRARIQRLVFEDEASSLGWAKQPPGPMPKPLPIKAIGIGVGLIVLAIAIALIAQEGWRAVGGILLFLLALGLAGYAAYRRLRRLEQSDPQLIRSDVKEHTKVLAAAEDQIVQNQMSSVIWIKPGWFRLAVLRVVLAFINFAARYISNNGTLAGIPSIHFARWVIVDEGRRLVFFSNFDGSWENYLGDFIDKAATGLTGVWSNCVGFPYTRNLIQEGAADEQKFKSYSRDSQIPTQVWYSAYKWLSVDNINNNSRVRLGLYGSMSEGEAVEWLRRL